MRRETGLLVVALAGLIGFVVLAFRFGPSDCPGPSARSVEGLFAPCLEQHAASEPAGPRTVQR